MKFLPSVAMFLVGLDCFMRGAGVESQSMFGVEWIWVWYVVGSAWWLNIVFFLLKKE